MNWGKFIICEYGPEEISYKSLVDEGANLLRTCGYHEQNLWRWILDIQTGEGLSVRVEKDGRGNAKADLSKHKIWVCPLFEPMLDWFYKNGFCPVDELPSLINLSLEEAPFALQGYRRGQDCPKN